MDYQKQYQKYRTRYLKLKNQRGGGATDAPDTLPEVQRNIIDLSGQFNFVEQRSENESSVAVLSSILNGFGKGLTYEQIADVAKKVTGFPTTERGIRAYPDFDGTLEALGCKFIEKFHIKEDSAYPLPTFEEVTRHLAGGKPIVVYMQDSPIGTMGYYVLIVGITSHGGEKILKIMDPNAGFINVRFDKFPYLRKNRIPFGWYQSWFIRDVVKDETK